MRQSIIILILVLLIAGCTSETIKELQSKEILEYEGEKLDSVGDFRENSIKGPQKINLQNYQLEISGLVNNKRNLSYEDVLDNQKYKKIVGLNCVEGWDVKLLWEGVLVKDLIKEAEILPKANTIIFYAYDGYSTSFPLKYVLDNDIMIAYKMNDVVLPPERGFPFQLVAESKWGYKWIKWITRIELSSDSDYEGFWESRGYSNTGDLNEGFYD